MSYSPTYVLGPRRHLSFAVLILFQAGCSAPVVPSGRSPAGSHNIVFRAPTYFADEVESPEWDVPIVNDSRFTVQFANVIRSCACTEAQLTRDVLQPGEQCHLRMRAHLRGRRGEQRLACQLITTQGTVWNCEVVTHVRERLEFIPSVVDCGVVEPHSKLDRFVLLDQFDGPRAVFSEPVLTIDRERLRVHEVERSISDLGDGFTRKRTKYSIEVHAGGSPGTHLAAMSAMSREEHGSVRMNVVWNVRAQFYVSPARLFVGDVSGADRRTDRIVTISNVKGEPFEVRRVSATESAVQVRLLPSDNRNEKRVSVSLDSSRIADKLWGEVLIETDNPTQPLLKVPIGAYVRRQQSDEADK